MATEPSREGATMNKFGPTSRTAGGDPARAGNETPRSDPAGSGPDSQGSGPSTDADNAKDVIARGKMAWWYAREHGQKDAQQKLQPQQQQKLQRNQWGVCEFGQDLSGGRPRHLVRNLNGEEDFDDGASWMSWRSGAASSDASGFTSPLRGAVKRSSSLESSASARWMSEFLKEKGNSAAVRNDPSTPNASDKPDESDAPSTQEKTPGPMPIYGQNMQPERDNPSNPDMSGNGHEADALLSQQPSLRLMPVFGQKNLSGAHGRNSSSSSDAVADSVSEQNSGKPSESDPHHQRWGLYQFKKQDEVDGERPRHLARSLARAEDSAQRPGASPPEQQRADSWVSFTSRSNSARSIVSSEPSFVLPQTESARMMAEFLDAKDDSKKIDHATARMLKHLYLKNQEKLDGDKDGK